MKAHTRKSSKGNTLAMVLTFFLFAGFMIGMVIMIYNQFLGTQKEAATAIDAAALQAAKDMSLITVDGPLGKIALVDNPAPTSNKYPVTGVNTLVATLRLDALIADKLGNKNMLYLVNQDAVRSVSAINQLRQKIQAASLGQSGAYDRNGAVVNMKQNAQTAYDSNAIRLGNKKSTDSKTAVSIEIGTLTVDSTTGQTNVPTPSQPGSGVTDADINGSNSYVSNGISFYRPNVSIPIPGLTGSAIRLAALPDSVSLADKAYFSKLGGTTGNDLATAVAQLPTCVQVTASENVNTMVPAGGVKSRSISVQATATAGGQRMTAATGTLVVSFPQGFPGNPDNQAGDSTPLTFNSVKSMMNAVQFTDPKAAQPTVDTADETKTYNGGTGPKGVWFQADGSNFPSTGSLNKKKFKGLPGRDFDNPSVCMSFLVYDWLRSMGLRPNAKSVVDALSFDLKTYVNSSGSPKSFPTSKGIFNFQPVYAQEQQLPGILTAFLILSDGKGDPRDLTRWSQDAASYSRQEVRMWGYIPADSILPSNSPVALLRPDGDLTTTDGNPVKDLTDFDDALSVTNNHAFETNVAVVKLLAKLCNQNLGTNISIDHPETMSDADREKLAGQEGIAFAKTLSEKYPGLDNAWRNAAYCMQVTDTIDKNKKTLTGGGVKKIGSAHFIVMDTDFFPATRAATENEILANMSSTGQDSQAPIRNWCAPMKKGANGKLESSLVFYKRTQEPVIGRRSNDHGWLPPALAQGSIPANNMLKFMFHLGDPNTPNASVVFLHPSPNSPFAKVPTGNKQAEYQNSQAIKVASTSDKSISVTWQFRARDLHCNAYEQKDNDDTSAPNPNSAATHFTANALPSYKRDGLQLIPPALAENYDTKWCSPDNTEGCQTVAAEGTWTCPQPDKPPITPSLNPPPAPPVYYPPPWSPPPPPPCWTYSYFRVEPPWAAPGTIYALLYVSCRYYNGCGALINATHS